MSCFASLKQDSSSRCSLGTEQRPERYYIHITILYLLFLLVLYTYSSNIDSFIFVSLWSSVRLLYFSACNWFIYCTIPYSTRALSSFITVRSLLFLCNTSQLPQALDSIIQTILTKQERGEGRHTIFRKPKKLRNRKRVSLFLAVQSGGPGLIAIQQRTISFIFSFEECVPCVECGW